LILADGAEDQGGADQDSGDQDSSASEHDIAAEGTEPAAGEPEE
jgi:hypothetical protein